jgi:nucleotide-binding universal stress UspA family protein
MFERILIALDESAPADNLLCATMAVAHPRRASLSVVSVRQASNAMLVGGEATEIQPSPGEAVELAATRLCQAGYRAHAVVRLTAGGGVADEVIRAIDETRPDLVVMGSRGLSDLRALVVGSVSHRVLSHTACPVLIVRGDTHLDAPKRLLLAFDDSRHSRRAARVAADLAKATGAEIEVVSISQPLLAVAAVAVNDAAAARRVDELVTALRCEVVASGSVKVSAAGKAAAIAQTAEQSGSDMIVMGTRGLSRIAGAVIGSVSHEVIHLTSRQVLLVP